MGSSGDYLKRLEALNGGPLHFQRDVQPDVDEIRRRLERKLTAPPTPRTEPAPIRYLRNMPRSDPKAARPCIVGQPVVLEEAIPGREIAVREYGHAYLVRAALGAQGGMWEHIREGFLDALAEPASSLHTHLLPGCAGGPFLPEEVIVVDVETTGLGNSPLFLIGSLSWEEDDLVVRQYLARTYAEEPAVTAAFLDDARNKRLLVSFNGKSFDIPYIRTRAAACGIPYSLAPDHFDLLHTARRIWRGTLPDCRLQTLERHICGRTRNDDIPGAAIPDAYHDYVRTGNAAQIVQIIKHNMLDLVTLTELMTRLPVRK